MTPRRQAAAAEALDMDDRVVEVRDTMRAPHGVKLTLLNDAAPRSTAAVVSLLTSLFLGFFRV